MYRSHLIPYLQNVFRLIPTWPEGFTYRHLKWDIIVNLIDEREDMLKKLDKHLDKSKFTYEQAVMEIINRDNLEAIPDLLGDFILAAISIVTGLPIIVIKPSIEQMQDANLMPVTNYHASVDYLFHKDKNAGKGPNLVMLVWNGINYYCPALPREIVQLTRSTTRATTHLTDAIRLLDRVLNDIPGSNASADISKALRHMWAGKSHLERAQLTTGTATPAPKDIEVSVPHSLPSADAAKMAHKRAASSRVIPVPEKRAKESESDFKQRRKVYEKEVTLLASCNTCLEKNQCPCGEVFPTEDELETHMASTHTDPKAWVCPKCNDTLSSKGKLWQHVRHHLGKYKYYCDCKYFDAKKLDEERNPIEQTCIRGSDEESYILFHHKKEHNVGRAKIRCQYCDKPQISNRSKKEHEKVCPSSGTPKEEATDFCTICDYSCWEKGSLRNHMNVEHPESVGLKKGKRWRCTHCKKIYRSRSGAAQHSCPLKKKKSRQEGICKSIFEE